MAHKKKKIIRKKEAEIQNEKSAEEIDEEQEAVDNFKNEIINAVLEFKNESNEVKQERLKKNEKNWRAYHGIHDWSHKKKGQARVFLHKPALAAEQITALFKASLINFDKWFSVERVGSIEDPLFTPHLAKEILRLYLDKADVKTFISDGVKNGLHESLVTLKLTGEDVLVPSYIAPSSTQLKASYDTEWRLRLQVISAVDYFPDPTGEKLYEIHQIVTDKHRVLAKASESPTLEMPYDKAAVMRLGTGEPQDDEVKKARNRGEKYVARASRRVPIKLYEFWGTLLDRDGSVMKDPDSGREMKNVVITVGNDIELIRPPQKNPYWHQESPFLSAPLLRVPLSVWSKAVMDAAVDLNITASELFCLMIDGGLSAVFGIKQIRRDWLEDPRQVEEHVPSGITLRVNANAPVGAKVLERVDVGKAPDDVLPFFNVVTSLFAENVLQNETRLGSLPAKQVRATEIVQANQAITGVFEGLAGDFEDVFIEPLIQKAWLLVLQNVEKFPEDFLISVVGEQRAAQIQALSPQQRFARAAKGFKFQSKGLRSMVERLKDFQRIQQFMATIGANELMIQEFSREFSIPKLMGKIMRSLEIDEEEIKYSQEEIAFKRQMEALRVQTIAQAEVEGGAPQEAGPGRTAEVPSEEGISSPEGASGSPEGGATTEGL